MKRLLLLAAITLFTAACPVYGKKCIPAATEPCACSNGDEGTRVCGTDMSFGSCLKNGLACAARDAGTAPRADGGSVSQPDGGSTNPGADGGANTPDGGSVVPDAGPRDAGVVTPPDAGTTGVACVNFDAFDEVDPTQECTVDGTFCNPDEAGGNGGTCIAGDNCSFRNQTGCPSNATCHPAGVFGIDNQNGRFCGGAPGAGTHASLCTSNANCSRGFVCVPVSDTQRVCLKYCTPGVTSGNGSCTGIPGQDGGTASCFDLNEEQPASITSIPAGVCA